MDYFKAKKSGDEYKVVTADKRGIIVAIVPRHIRNKKQLAETIAKQLNLNKPSTISFGFKILI
jgi:hypothetical protein